MGKHTNIKDKDVETGANRRRHTRVRGPFDGWRVGPLDVPVRIQDLGLGGCFVNSTHTQRDGARIVLKIDLPNEGSITVTAESLYRRPGGYAVRFLELDADSVGRLARTVASTPPEAGDSSMPTDSGD